MLRWTLIEEFLKEILQQDTKNFVLLKCYFIILTELYIVACFLCLRLQQHSIERAMDLTDSFT